MTQGKALESDADHPGWAIELAESMRTGGRRPVDATVEAFPELARVLGAGDDVELHRILTQAAAEYSPEQGTSRDKRKRQANIRAALAWLWVTPYQLSSESWDADHTPKKPPHGGVEARHAWAYNTFDFFMRDDRGESARAASIARAPSPEPAFNGGQVRSGKTHLQEYRQALAELVADRLGSATPRPKAPQHGSPSTETSAREDTLHEPAPDDRGDEGRQPSPKLSRARWIISGVAALAVAALLGGLVLSLGRTDTAATAGGSGAVPAEAPPVDGASHKITPGAWWPARETFRVDNRPSVATLNSLIDNPVHGDERNFMQIRPSDGGDDSYADELVVRPGDVFTAFVYFGNDAVVSAEAAANTRLRMRMPGVITGSANAYAVVSSDTAAVSEVTDGVTIVTPSADEESALRYVADSARIHSGGAVDGMKLDDALFDEQGVLLGCDALDGTLPGGARCSGWVTFDVRVDQPDFELDAAARRTGSEGPFAGIVTVGPDVNVEVRLQYRNTGTTQQDDVVLRVPSLPGGIRYVNGSTRIANSTTDGAYRSTSDSLTTSGINIGSYQPGGNAFVVFTVNVSALAVENASSAWLDIAPVARVTTSNGYKEAGISFALSPDAEPAGTADATSDEEATYWRAAWGPERDLFEWKQGGAPYPVFNSLSDNTNIGDERNFVSLRRATDTGGTNVWYDDIWAKPGETYLMRIYVDNGGADTNDVIAAGRLQNARLQVGISRGDGESSVYGQLTADNAKTVWDGATFHFDPGSELVFDAGSALIENNAHTDGGLSLGPEAFSSAGVLLGYENMDGIIRPGFQYASYVTYRLHVVAGAALPASSDLWGPDDRTTYTTAQDRPPYPVFNAITDNPNYGDERNFATVKSVADRNAGGWLDDVWANPGESFALRVYGTNSGETDAVGVPAGSLHDAHLRLTVTKTGDTHVVTAELLSANADTIWDTVVIHTPPGVAPIFDRESFLLTDNAFPQGVALIGDPFSEDGAELGFSEQNGIIPPGYSYDFFVTAVFTAEAS